MFGIRTAKNIITFFPRKLIAINATIGRVAGLSEKVDQTYTLATKVTGASVGAGMASKGTADLLEALSCGDLVCATVSTVGLCADGLQCLAFVPGPNVTVVATLPISIFCKGFVYFCKRSMLPWGKCF
jgi:hypothetical protein